MAHLVLIKRHLLGCTTCFDRPFPNALCRSPWTSKAVLDAIRRRFFLRMYRETRGLLFVPSSFPCRQSRSSHGPILTVRETSGLEASGTFVHIRGKFFT